MIPIVSLVPIFSVIPVILMTPIVSIVRIIIMILVVGIDKRERKREIAIRIPGI